MYITRIFTHSPVIWADHRKVVAYNHCSTPSRRCLGKKVHWRCGKWIFNETRLASFLKIKVSTQKKQEIHRDPPKNMTLVQIDEILRFTQINVNYCVVSEWRSSLEFPCQKNGGISCRNVAGCCFIGGNGWFMVEILQHLECWKPKMLVKGLMIYWSPWRYQHYYIRYHSIQVNQVEISLLWPEGNDSEFPSPGD